MSIFTFYTLRLFLRTYTFIFGLFSLSLLFISGNTLSWSILSDINHSHLSLHMPFLWYILFLSFIFKLLVFLYSKCIFSSHTELGLALLSILIIPTSWLLSPLPLQMWAQLLWLPQKHRDEGSPDAAPVCPHTWKLSAVVTSSSSSSVPP